MRAVLLDVPRALLDERRRKGLDKRDELWDGVLHMVPPPGDAHQGLAGDLFRVLAVVADARGLRSRYETGLFRTARDYRVPDQLYARPEQLSRRGAEGAELLVEVRSPEDQTYEKLDWYADRGVREVLIVHPEDRRVELLRAVGGRLLPVTADETGAVRSEVLGATFATVAGRTLVRWEGGTAEV